MAQLAAPIIDGITPGADVTARHADVLGPGARAIRSDHPCRNLGCAMDVIVGSDDIPRYLTHAHADDLIACWA